MGEINWAQVKEIATLVFNYFIEIFKKFGVLPEDAE